MSRTIQHSKSETSTVKATLEVHYSNLLPYSCQRQAMKALTWQGKQLNEAVHIFHSSVWNLCHFKANSQHRLLRLAQPVSEALHTESDLSPWPSFDNRHIWSLLTWRRVSLLCVVHFSQVSCCTGLRWSVSSYPKNKSLESELLYLFLDDSFLLPFLAEPQPFPQKIHNQTFISPEHTAENQTHLPAVQQPQTNHASLHDSVSNRMCIVASGPQTPQFTGQMASS